MDIRHDNGRVLRTVFQMTRSGQFGRKGLSSSLQRAFQRWLNDASVASCSQLRSVTILAYETSCGRHIRRQRMVGVAPCSVG
jgi:hypothetical protein